MDLIVIFVIAAVLGGAGYAVWRSKKKGGACIGCPSGGSCKSCSCNCVK